MRADILVFEIVLAWYAMAFTAWWACSLLDQFVSILQQAFAARS